MKENKCGLCPEALSDEGHGFPSKNHTGIVSLIKHLGTVRVYFGGLVQSGRVRQNYWTF